MAPVKMTQVKWHSKNYLKVGGLGLGKVNISGPFSPTFLPCAITTCATFTDVIFI